MVIEVLTLSKPIHLQKVAETFKEILWYYFE